MNYRNPERKNWAASAKVQGSDARFAGRTLDTCPYPMGGTLSRLWRDGWQEADTESRMRPVLVTVLSAGRAS